MKVKLPAHWACGLLVAVLCGCGGLPPAPQHASVTAPPLHGASAGPSLAAGLGSPDTRPESRAGSVLEFDPISRELLLIGGYPDPNAVQGSAPPGHDFWAWRPGSGWAHVEAEHMPPSYYLAAGFWDYPAKKLTLIPPSAGQMWSWDGIDWSAAGPGPQTESLTGAAFDGSLGLERVLGVVSPVSYQEQATGARLTPEPNGPQDQVEAMWTWDGSRWSVSATPMSWREEGGVAYDQRHGQLVVYGGYGDADHATWLYDGSGWSSKSTVTYPIANQSSAVYDSVRNQVVMYAVDETWTWDGVTWTKHSVEGPGIRRDQAMAFDQDLGEVVMFGGKSPPVNGTDEVFHNDLWGWDGTAWTQIG